MPEFNDDQFGTHSMLRNERDHAHKLNQIFQVLKKDPANLDALQSLVKTPPAYLTNDMEHYFTAATRVSPKDPDIRSYYGMFCRALGRQHDADYQYGLVLELRKDRAVDYVDVAIQKKILTDFDLALDYLNKAEEVDPAFVLIFKEKGLIYQSKKEYSIAAENFRKAVTLAPDNQELSLLYRDAMSTVKNETLDTNSDFTIAENRYSDFYCIPELHRFINIYTPETVHGIHNRVRSRFVDGFSATKHNVNLFIRGRMSEKKPTSFIRLGDGEGAMLASTVYGTRFESLVARNKNIFTNIWFGQDYDSFTAEAAEITDELELATENADIIGLPDFGWIKSNYDDLDLRGTSSTVACLLSVAALPVNAPLEMVVATSAAQWLHRTEFFDEIVREQKFLGVVTCHDVADIIKSQFGVEEVDQYRIPNQKAYTFSDFDINSLKGYSEEQHYPDAFNAIRETLTVPFRGALFLVGAGVLGKIYCHWIKQRGGIAIDVGSLMDAWMGLGTRPYIVERRDEFKI